MNARLEPFAVLASAVAEGRLSPQEFVQVCLPLYKHYAEPFPSEAHYQMATELFYMAADYYGGEGDPGPGELSGSQLKSAALDLSRRMNSLLEHQGS
ncbi:hypothetical protein ADK60_20620 [Streptomyces sp. XY431]|nr:hypothetical protein ADK60_20620 [Streptomyces sp. XY431]